MYLFARADVNPNWPPELATRRAHEITIVWELFRALPRAMQIRLSQDSRFAPLISCSNYPKLQRLCGTATLGCANGLCFDLTNHQQSLPPARILRNRQVDLTDGAV
jgi:hypothetical protein